MTPLDHIVLLINSLILGEDPTIEDFILLVGTIVALMAFVLWFCFPITLPEEQSTPAKYDNRKYNLHKKTDCNGYY